MYRIGSTQSTMNRSFFVKVLCVFVIITTCKAYCGSTEATILHISQSVEVLWKDEWCQAKIIAVNDEQYLIHYTGYNESWDEWVVSSRIRVIKFLIGDVVSVLWEGQWYNATIVDIRHVPEKKYQVSYHNYDASWDEWVNPKRVKSIPNKQ